jgi:hypothetical protein
VAGPLRPGLRQAETLTRVTGEPTDFAAGGGARATLFALSVAHGVSLVLSHEGWKAPATQYHREDVAAFSAIFDSDISNLLTQSISIDTLQNVVGRGPFVT